MLIILFDSDDGSRGGREFQESGYGQTIARRRDGNGQESQQQVAGIAGKKKNMIIIGGRAFFFLSEETIRRSSLLLFSVVCVCDWGNEGERLPRMKVKDFEEREKKRNEKM
jgi:hypothetical protein